MIDPKIVENIKKHGAFKDSGEARLTVMKEDIGFRMDQKAEYVIVGGCIQPEAMPNVFTALRDLLESLAVDYTFLSKEYCCGWMPIGQPAVITKNDEDIASYRKISRDFIIENFKQAETLGAKSLVLFCSACEPNYNNYKDLTKIELILYTELLDRHFKGGELQREVDFYPGCYRFRRRITENPIDTEHAIRVLKKIEGLQVNYLDSELCCYKPAHLEKLVSSIATDNVITTCTGCYHNLKGSIQGGGNHRVLMLPEVLIESI